MNTPAVTPLAARRRRRPRSSSGHAWQGDDAKLADTVDPTNVQRMDVHLWERRTEIPLLMLALAFLVAYAWPVVDPEGP